MAAYDALDLSKDCTIVVCGEFTQAKSFNHTANFTGSVTLTSVYDGVDYRKNGAAIVSPGARFVCNGKTIFKDIDFRLTGKYYCVVAQHNPLVFDTGVTMTSTDAGFIGTGCAISQASASLMIDLVKGRTVEDARRLIGLYFDMIKGKITPEQLDDLEDVAALQGIAHVPARVKCAVLAWHTLEEALDGEGKI